MVDCSKCGKEMEYHNLLGCLYCPICTHPAMAGIMQEIISKHLFDGKAFGIYVTHYNLDGTNQGEKLLVYMNTMDEAREFIRNQKQPKQCSCGKHDDLGYRIEEVKLSEIENEEI